ncbi:MAG: peptidylprolyl isomerase [Kiritimatiellaeota bacterium]|nr:peptidylprolyl isomerase [Kiritimatiellota bacterium]
MQTRALVLCSALLAVVVHTETVKLKDGRTLRGSVVTKKNTVTVVSGTRLFQFAKAQVAEITSAPAKAPEAAAKEKAVKNPTIKIKTSKGDITLELFEDQAPNTVANLIELAEKGFYKGLAFHRIIPGFMVQGGCPYSKEGAHGTPGTGGPGYRFADECRPELRFDQPGLLAMANSGPNTNGSQFFITLKATPWLNGRHTIFGKVTDGMDVLREIEAVGTESGKPKERVAFDITVVSKRDHAYAVKKLP